MKLEKITNCPSFDPLSPTDHFCTVPKLKMMLLFLQGVSVDLNFLVSLYEDDS